MWAVPLLSNATYASIYEVFFKGNNLLNSLKNIYFTDTASFFIVVILQQGCVNLATQLLRLSELFFAFLSPQYADLKRKTLNDGDKWKQNEGDFFPFGYYYALMIAVIFIILTFSTSVYYI
jgi:hypothetical protein